MGGGRVSWRAPPGEAVWLVSGANGPAWRLLGVGAMKRLLPVCFVISFLAACTVQSPPASTTPAPATANPTANPPAANGDPAANPPPAAGSPSNVCQPGRPCSWSCPQGGCQYMCTTGSNCTASCPGGKCSLSCATGANCNVSCATKDCSVTCAEGANCRCDGGSCAAN